MQTTVEQDVGGAAGERGPSSRTTVLVGAVLALPLVALLLRSIVDPEPSPSGDVSLIELRTLDVGTEDTPLLGSYGRFGFNHPGPLWFALLALPYRLTGDLRTGVLLAGIASVAGILWVAARRGALWWTAVPTAVLVWGAGPVHLSDPWEPHGLLLPAAALVLLAIDSLHGRAWSLPLAAGVASLLATAQATLLPFAVALGALAVVGAVRARARGPLLVAVLVVVVCWAPTLVQQATGERPNLTALLDARSSAEPSLGIGGAWDAVALFLGHRSPALGFAVPLEPLSPIVDLGAAPLVPVALVALVAVAVVAVACRRRPLVPIVALVSIATGIVAMSQLLGPVYSWIPEWLAVVAFASWLATGWVVRDRLPVPLLVVLAVGLSLGSTWRAAVDEADPDHLGDAVRTLVADLGELDAPVLVASSFDADILFAGEDIATEVVVLALERRGTDTRVVAGLADKYGPARAQPAEARSAVCLRAGGTRGLDPLPPELRAERRAILARSGVAPDGGLGDVLRAVQAGEATQADADRLADIPDLPQVDLVRGPCPAR